jgi:hypothetical protein
MAFRGAAFRGFSFSYSKIFACRRWPTNRTIDFNPARQWKSGMSARRGLFQERFLLAVLAILIALALFRWITPLLHRS